MEFLCWPIVFPLLLNLRSGMRANGSSKDNIICTKFTASQPNQSAEEFHTIRSLIMHLLLVHTIKLLISCIYRFCKWCLCRQTVDAPDGGNNCTDAMMMRRPAPLDPPMMATIKLGTMAILRVIRFLSHCFILMSKKP